LKNQVKDVEITINYAREYLQEMVIAVLRKNFLGVLCLDGRCKTTRVRLWFTPNGLNVSSVDIAQKPIKFAKEQIQLCDSRSKTVKTHEETIKLGDVRGGIF